MSRVKTFDSTGLATSGRLYAGDLNQIQDQYADLSNLLQALAVGSLAVGESGLQVVRYGVGEARISGALRTDGILRALGGLYAGGFTTAQRDALDPTLRPYGLVILNTTSNRLEINLGSGASPAWTGLNVALTRGLLGARPAASPANTNNVYFATDDQGGTLYYSDGATWTKISRGLTEPISTAMIPDGSVTLAKMGFDVATQAELDLVSGRVSTAPTIWLSAAGMWPTLNSGAGQPSQITIGGIDLFVIDFVDGQLRLAQVNFPLPNDFSGSALTVQFEWLCSNPTGGQVVWAAQGVTLADAQSLGAAFGNWGAVIDGSNGQNVQNISPPVTVTLAGSPAPGRTCYLSIGRSGSDGSDSLADIARLIGVKLSYTRA